MCATLLDPDVSAEMRQHFLGMVARGFGFDHDGLARRRKPGEQHRRFELCGRNRRLVDDRDRIARAGKLQRQAAVVCDERMGADPLQRLEHALHRAFAE